MALPAFRSVGTGAGSTGNITPGLPSGYQANDIFILTVESNTAVTTPSGYTAVSGSPVTAGSMEPTSLNVFWKRASASETAPTVTGGSDHKYGIIAAFSGCTTSQNPIHVTTTGTNQVDNLTTSLSANGVTTTVNDCLIVIVAGHSRDNAGSHYSGWSNANLSDLTERTDAGTTQGGGGGIAIADGGKATAGATGSTSVTYGSATIQTKVFLTLALLPLTTTTYKIEKSLTYRIGSKPSITKSLTYCIYAKFSQTKQLIYRIKTIPSAIQKSLQYVIIQVSTYNIQKSLIYAVKTIPSAIQKTLIYRIKSFSSITKNLLYAVKITITSIEKQIVYTIKKPQPIAKPLAYSVKSVPSAIQKQLEYAVKTIPSAIQKQLQYVIKKLNVLEKPLEYAIKTIPSPLQKSLTYAVSKAISIQKTLTYAIKKANAITKSLQYEVSPVWTITIAKNLAYFIKTITSVQKNLAYKIRLFFSAQKLLEYVIFRVNSITKSLKYGIFTQTDVQKDLTYKIRITPEPIQKELTYDARELKIYSIQKGLQYAVKLTFSLKKSLKYRILGEPPEWIFVDGEMAKRIFSNHYVKI